MKDTPVSQQSILEVLTGRVEKDPDRVGFIYLEDGETQESRITWRQLQKRAQAIAWKLSQSGLSGERILLTYPPGLDFIAAFFGCLSAGAIAVPLHPARPNRSLARIHSIIDDCGPTAALSTDATYAQMTRIPDVKLQQLSWITTTTLPDAPSSEPGLSISPGDIAFLQYTSGSTGDPKGVMVSHANLMHNEALMNRAFAMNESSVVASWLPLYHDMGLIGSVLQTVYCGATAVLMSPLAFLQRPARWLSAISRYHATISGAPNFAYDLCTQKISDAELAGLDLSTWAVAFNGAEPVHEETIARFAERFAACGFRRQAFLPCYGLAEATLFVSGRLPGQGARSYDLKSSALEAGEAAPAENGQGRRVIVSCGIPADGQRVSIVDPDLLSSCPPGRIGEIWISGESVAQGYWNRPQQTEETFGARVMGGDGARHLRTGDLGFMRGSELYVTGRRKDLIIIRGRNHYPQDIEATVARCYSGFRPSSCVAVAIEREGEEQLAVIQEVNARRGFNAGEAIAAILQAVAQEHEVQVGTIALVMPGSVLKTSSGKARRQECGRALLLNQLKLVAEWHSDSQDQNDGTVAPLASLDSAAAVEGWLAAEVAVVLGLEPGRLDVNRSLAQYGVDSLRIVQLHTRLERGLGLALPLSLVAPETTAARLAGDVWNALNHDEGVVRSAPVCTQSEPATIPLSAGQRALWFLHNLAPDHSAYNIARAVRMRGVVPRALSEALRALSLRHEALRARFQENASGPYQTIQAEPLTLEYEPDFRWGEDELRAKLAGEARRPFDLGNGPVFRLHLFLCHDSSYVLLLVAHHIVTDLWALEIVFQDLMALYSSALGHTTAPLPAIQFHYRGYAKWQQSMLESSEGERLAQFWEAELVGPLEPLELPADRPRPQLQTFSGACCHFQIDSSLAQAARELAATSNVTLFTLLLACFQALLYRYTGQAGVLVGSPASCRIRPGLSELVGYLVNPIVLHSSFEGEFSFRELLGILQHKVLSALAHQEYPFPLLAERLQAKRDSSRSPVFDVMFVWHQPHRLGSNAGPLLLGQEGGRIVLDGGVELESLAVPHNSSQFDLTLAMTDERNSLLGTLEYNTDLFNRQRMERMATHFQVLLASAVQNLDGLISELPLLSPAEREQVTREYNQTLRNYSGPECLHHGFEQQAKQKPGAVALAWEGRQMLYAELDAAANRVARVLRSRGIGVEDRVGVCLERSFDMVLSLLGVLKAGAAYVPLDPGYPVARLAAMTAGESVRIALTARRYLEQLPANVTALALDEIKEELESQSSESVSSGVGPDNLAYVIYTSGSTGLPKGVMITHRGIVNRLQWMQEAYGLEADEVVLQKTPYSFDVSVWEFFWPLNWGARLVLARAGGHQDPVYLGELLERERITMAHFVPSMLRVFLEEETAVKRCTSLKRVIASGEALEPELVKRFYACLPGVELHNLYGPTEASVEVTAWACERSPEVAPIGRPIANMRTYVLDRKGNPTPIGVAGELYLGGIGLARGYIGQPALTAELFLPDPCSGTPGERLYRTGDRARYGEDGNCEYLGRFDSQVKVRGFRIELGEIEAVLAADPAVRQAAVLVREDNAGGKNLIGYIVPKEMAGSPDLVELKQSMRGKLPDYMVPSVLVPLESLPLNVNGKLDRKALAAVAVTNTPPSRLPRNGIEEMLAQIWGDLLKLERVGIDNNFFELGGHSLLATQSMTRVNAAFGIRLPLRLFLEVTTIAELAHVVESELGKNEAQQPLPAMRRSDEKETPLSFAQQRLWFLNQLDPVSAAYNVPGALRIQGSLNVHALTDSISSIAERHEVLRASFVERNGTPVQVVAPGAGPGFQFSDLQQISPSQRSAELERLMREEAEQPFDLRRGPCLRIHLLQLGPQEHVLLVTMHHIVSDYWSLGIFVSELTKLYPAFNSGQNSPLQELRFQYRDFAVWQRECLAGSGMAAQLEHWKQQLAGILPVLELPADHVRTLTQSGRGAICEDVISKDLTAALKKLFRPEGATLFMVLLAAFKVLLHRYSGQKDLIVGSPVANRNHAGIEDLIGFFANTLVLRSDLSGDPPFADLLRRVHKMALHAYAHQDVPFEKLVEELQPERDTARSPIFQVSFALQNVPFPTLELPGLHVEIVNNPTRTAKFDLTLIAVETGPAVRLSLEYRTDLFEERRVQRMLKHFKALLESIVRAPSLPISGLSYMDQQEVEQVLHDWNRTEKLYRRGLTVQQLIEEQVERTPEAVALVYQDQQCTYAELNRRANQLAHLLREHGVAPEVRVGLFMERSLELVISILATLKAGGAYVPLDPSYPEDRLRFIAQDAGIRIVLTQQHLLDAATAFTPAVVDVKSEWPLIHLQPDENPPYAAGEDNMAYVIYTSGSTGRPKGVMITHAGICNRLLWMQDEYGLSGNDAVLQKTPFSFDVSVWEFLWPLMTGARLVMAKPGAHHDPAAIANLIEREKITTVHFVPSMLQVFIDDPALPECASLKRIICSGEALSPALRDKCASRLSAGLHNLYGPTEASVDVTYSDCRAERLEATVPIGRPIANIQVHFLDEYWQPVPAGVWGELCIAGVGLARGYLDRPGMTAERFIPNAFSNRMGDRLYRTGDIARYLSDGAIEYLGRADDQVKVRGFRIEPGEIEKAISDHEAVQECIVLARNDVATGKRLVAYVVPGHENAFTVHQLLEMDKEGAAHAFYELPNGMTVAHLNKGETDFTYREIFEGQGYLQHGVTLHEGDCVFDVGANIGLFTLFAARSVSRCQIYAFEPIPAIFECLRSNARLYGLQAHLVQCGIGREARTESFTYYPGMSILSGRFADHHKDQAVLRAYVQGQQSGLAVPEVAQADIDAILKARLVLETVSVPVRTISDVIREHAVERIDLLKIDVEGGEIEVLEGIVDEDWPRIRQIVVEVHDVDGRLQQMLGMLARREYRVVAEQAEFLRQTGLYNVFAVRSSPAVEKNGAETGGRAAASRNQWTSAARLVSSLRDHLRRRLPDYMVPASFVLLDAMPLTANGKVDRRALLALGEGRPLAEQYVAPRTPLQETLVRIWSEILDRKDIGINDNFFSLGGHSLLIPRLVQEISRETRVELQLFQIFQSPTIASLEEAITADRGKTQVRATPAGIRQPDAVTLLDNFEKLSDDQVQSLLESLLQEKDSGTS